MFYSLASTGILLTKAVLALYSVLVVAVVVERLLTLNQVSGQERSGYKAVIGVLTAGRSTSIAAALAQAARYQASPSCVALLVAGETLKRLPPHAALAAEQTFASRAAGLRRGLPAIASVASTAPYVGLFGTVLGILAAFHTIAMTGQTGASIVAGGVTEALVTTAMGLAVAVPSVLAYNWLTGVVNDVTMQAEANAREYVAYLLAAANEAVAP
ncbi:MAG: MotA/TolQ/ExbB proton channel family protein [Capsulimonadaceae bacterium]|nr:MotA/TolQ/ExbB proton channel family protein [Capsulimonadaceae bacterium]